MEDSARTLSEELADLQSNIAIVNNLEFENSPTLTINAGPNQDSDLIELSFGNAVALERMKQALLVEMRRTAGVLEEMITAEASTIPA